MRRARDTWEVAGALVDGDPVDWSRVGSPRSPRQASIIRSLQSLSTLGPVGAAAHGPGSYEPAGWPAVAILGIAAAQILAGTVGFALGHAAPSPVPPVASAAVAAAFTAAAIWLCAGGGQDRRAWDLGGFYLLVAAAFARRFAGASLDSPLAFLVTGVFPDAFLPAFLWSFVSRFPRVLRFSSGDRVHQIGVRTSVTCGLLLFTVNLGFAWLADEANRHLLHPGHPSGLYWAIVLGLCAAALLWIVVRARRASAEERRRVALFYGVLLLTVAPLVVETLAEILVPAFDDLMSRPPVRRGAALGLFALLLLLPLGTAYAVVVERILDVRVVVGRALQYLLARITLILLTLTPFALLVVHGVRNRELSIGELFAGSAGLTVAALTSAGALLLGVRSRLLLLVDRIFLRASVDLARELTALAADLGPARSAVEALERTEDAIVRATGASAAWTGFFEPAASPPSRGPHLQVPAQSACATLMRADPLPLPVGPAETRTVFSMLPPAERRWVVESGVAVLVPVHQSGDTLTGFMGVGPKRNGLAFDPGELLFLGGAANALSLALVRHHGEPDGPALVDDPAGECPACATVLPSSGSRCACGSTLRVAAVPAVLNGKFAVDRRLGAGGMGVVYRAVDSTLARPVALKTLSRLSSAAAGRLAQEARVMAAVAHPHLAAIYGVEHWRGTPVLVVEYCERGTLADRLLAGPLPIGDALQLGLRLAAALDELHRAGVLHRDVKPSNIGFTAKGTPRLLDFGIASYASVDPSPASLWTPETAPRQTQSIETGAGAIAGTPLYMSPEVLGGGAPDVRLDLWALALVIYEAIAGRHPFAAATVPGVIALVRKGRVGDVRRIRPDCPEDVAEAFSVWLAPDVVRRPASARALHQEISSLIAGQPRRTN
jgi:hypothetical protein